MKLRAIEGLALAAAVLLASAFGAQAATGPDRAAPAVSSGGSFDQSAPAVQLARGDDGGGYWPRGGGRGDFRRGGGDRPREFRRGGGDRPREFRRGGGDRPREFRRGDGPRRADRGRGFQAPRNADRGRRFDGPRTADRGMRYDGPRRFDRGRRFDSPRRDFRRGDRFSGRPVYDYRRHGRRSHSRHRGYPFFFLGWWYATQWWLPYYASPAYADGGSCGYWQDQCIANWGYDNPDFYGCMQYYGCY